MAYDLKVEYIADNPDEFAGLQFQPQRHEFGDVAPGTIPTTLPYHWYWPHGTLPALEGRLEISFVNAINRRVRWTRRVAIGLRLVPLGPPTVSFLPR
jgi:hypothetical protein